MTSAGTTPQRSSFWLRIRAPVVIVVLAVVVLAGIALYPEIDNGTRSLATLSALALFVFLLTIWLLVFSGLSRAVRVAVLVAEIVPLALLRIEGYSGDLRPHIGWRWSGKRDASLDLAPSDSAPADLVHTTDHDFPQFLGPARDGRVAGVRLARDWSRPPRKLWRQPIGAGWSGFAVVGSYAVTQEQRGDDELVVCYELETGKPRWSHADRGRYDSVMAGDGPRSTPTIDGGLVYTLGARGILNCLDGATGKILWARNIVEETGAPLPMWGMSVSPLVVDGLVVLSAGGPDGYSIVAYERKSGTVVWHAGNAAASYASPVLMTLNGRRQIVVVNSGDCTAHDPADGHILWHFDWPGDQPKVPDPVLVDAEHVLVAAGYGLGTTLLNIKPEGAAETARELWTSRALKPKFSNVLVRDMVAYGLDDGMALTRLDLKTRRTKKQGRYGHGQMLLVGDLLLVQAESGDVVLVDPKTLDELGRFSAIGDKAWNTPALAGPYLLVRNHQEAACYELPLEAPVNPTR